MKKWSALLRGRLARYLLFVCITPVLAVGSWHTYEYVGIGTEASAVVVVFLFVLGMALLVFTTMEGNNGAANSNEETYLEMLRSQERFVALYEQSPIPYIILNKYGTVSMYNEAAIHIFDATTDELWGVKLQDLLQSEDAGWLRQIQSKLARREAITEAEIQISTMSGQTRFVLLSVSLSQYGHERLVSLVDITHQKEVDAVKSEFVALATHQLRTPIAAIRWNVELLQRKIDPAAGASVQTYIQKIERNVTRMNALINDFLNVSKLEMGTFATEPTQLNLCEHFESIVDEFAKEITAKSLTIEQSYEPETLSTYVDERLLHIVVSNLLSNAVKYVSNEDTVSIGYKLAGATITITVADTGIGIPKGEQEKLFKKFYRASNALQHQAEGTGLGLYVVRQSVEQLGGTITVESAVNQGTTFVVKIPHRVT